MTDTLSFPATLSLRDHAADALRRARRLPVGPARNDLRQLAIGLRFLDIRQQDVTAAYPIPDVPPGEASLVPPL